MILFFKQFKSAILALLIWFVYGLSFLVPKNKKIWVVMGWRRDKNGEVLGDNAKYFFLYASQNLKNIKVIWIAQDDRVCSVLRDFGYNSFSIRSLKGVWTSLRAGYTIVDANLRLENWVYSGNSRIVQLWHGKSLKKMGQNSPYAMGKYSRFFHPYLFCRFYCLISASRFLGEFNVSGFRMSSEDLLPIGLPRYDVLFSEIKDSDIDIDQEFKKKLESLKLVGYNKIIFYAPTFRPDGSNPLAGADLGSLNQVLLEKNSYCLVSMHPKFATKDWQPKEKFSNLEFVNAGPDIYPLIRQFDLLISDYSSLILDFLLVNIPSILYIYDLESFNKGMGIHKEIAGAVPGPRVENFESLIETLKGDSYIWTNVHDRARDLFFTFQDANSAQRITNAILETILVPGKTISTSRRYLKNN